LIATQLKLVAWLVVTAAGLALVVWLTNR